MNIRLRARFVEWEGGGRLNRFLPFRVAARADTCYVWQGWQTYGTDGKPMACVPEVARTKIWLERKGLIYIFFNFQFNFSTSYNS